MIIDIYVYVSIPRYRIIYIYDDITMPTSLPLRHQWLREPKMCGVTTRRSDSYRHHARIYIMYIYIYNKNVTLVVSWWWWWCSGALTISQCQLFPHDANSFASQRCVGSLRDVVNVIDIMHATPLAHTHTHLHAHTRAPCYNNNNNLIIIM